MAIFSSEAIEFLLRWGHFLAGITWIGLLYYFNFIQGSWFKEISPEVKAAAVRTLVPRALWWFRWGAMGTWLTGVAILGYKGHMDGMEIFYTSWGVNILLGGLLGTCMFLNVWLIIWPNQRVLIASEQSKADGGAGNPDAAQCGVKAGFASRTNTFFSIPLLFFMGAAKNFPIDVGESLSLFWIPALILVGLLEFLGIKGKLPMITSVRGVITSGFVLTAIFYLMVEFLA